MPEYLIWQEKNITDFSDAAVNALYHEGFLFTRKGKGVAIQTRSLRIDLSRFEPSSENRRVLRKVEAVTLHIHPLPYQNYHWSLGKLGKDFYEHKFGPGVFSAQKIKELLTKPEKSNFNRLFLYTCHSECNEESLKTNGRDPSALPQDDSAPSMPVGYCIALETNELLHYCYPFYQLSRRPGPDGHRDHLPPNIGLGMMLKAIVWAKEQGKKYIYLGSFQRPSDTYKLQFEGLEWFDGRQWMTDLEKLKNIL